MVPSEARTSAKVVNSHGLMPLSEGSDGTAMYGLIADLYPICRSITGNGVRETLREISQQYPLAITEVPSGLPIFDWIVPLEWNIHDAYIKNCAGERIVDFRRSNLHVVSYSLPIRRRIGIVELKKYLHWDEDNPNWIPYRTAYYKHTWGFCLTYNQMLAMIDDEYEVCIESTLQPGHLTYGEIFLKGQSDDEVLISCHVCHPSLANDNLSGIAVATALAQHLGRMKLRYSYRFLFIPGTIGSITWISLNQDRLARIKHGFALTCVGDCGAPIYKESRQGNAEIDRAWKFVLGTNGGGTTRPFSPYGYDERQFCSPGINLPIGCFMRTPHGEFAQYHTSADDLDFVKPSALKDSLARAIAVIDVIENNAYFLNRKPYCEPHLGKYNLYNEIGGFSASVYQMALLWLLNMSDGHNSLLDIATKAHLDWEILKKAAEALCKAELLVSVMPPVA